MLEKIIKIRDKMKNICLQQNDFLGFFGTVNFKYFKGNNYYNLFEMSYKGSLNYWNLLIKENNIKFEKTFMKNCNILWKEMNACIKFYNLKN